MKKKITAKELAEGIISGEFTIIANGHAGSFSEGKWFIDRLKTKLERSIANANGANDGNWCKHDKEEKTEEENREWDERMRNVYQTELNRELEHGGDLYWFRFFDDCGNECQRCGKRLYASVDLVNKTISFDRTIKNSNKDGIDWNMLPTCEMHGRTEFTAEINIDSTFILTNFFPDEVAPDEPEGEKYSHKYSLNILKGRENITKYHESNNVAFGQLTNTSASIFISDDRKSIIVGECYGYNEETEEEYDVTFEGYTMLEDSICCDVWRWMGVDLNTIEKKKPLEELRKEYKHKEFIECDVVHGKWKVTHFYDFIRNGTVKDSDIWARLDLIEE